MKRTCFLLLFSFFLSVCQLHAQKLLVGGSGWDTIVIVDKESKKIEWKYPLEKDWECNSVATTPDGNILFSYRKGAKLITKDKTDLWNIVAPAGCEMQSATVLPNGNCLIAWCGSPAVIMEVGKDGGILSKTEFDTHIENPHAQFRQIIKNKKGNYIVPLFETSSICEINIDGKIIKRTPLEGDPFSAAPLKNGNYLVACGDAHCYKEVNLETGKVVRTIRQNDIEGAKLFFVAQLLPSDNGYTYICNWLGHKPNDSIQYPSLIEIDETGKMVWCIDDTEILKRVSSVSIIQ